MRVKLRACVHVVNAYKLTDYTNKVAEADECERAFSSRDGERYVE